MRKSSTHIATLSIIFSMITATVQLAAYYYLGSGFLTFGISAIVILLFSHILLEQSFHYESCFSYSLLNVFICMIIILLSYYGGNNSFLPYDPFFFVFIIVSWIIPMLYCMVRYLSNPGSRYQAFHAFYRNSSILFFILYISSMVYFFFIQQDAATYNGLDSIQIIPTASITGLWKNYSDGTLTFYDFILYFVKGILLFVPYGFYLALVLKHSRVVTKILAFIFLPLLIEVLQNLFYIGISDIDDVLLALLGGILGLLFYFLQNSIFRYFTNEDFLYKSSSRSYYHSSLHF